MGRSRSAAQVLTAATLTAGLLAGCGMGEESAAESAAPPAPVPASTSPRFSPESSGAVPEPEEPAPTADPSPAVPETPVCTYDDVPTRFGELEHWAITLLDTSVALSPDYYPDDLVPVGAAGVQGWGEVRALMVDDLAAMDAAAREVGAGFAVRSAFRDYATQQGIFQEWVGTIGEEGALAESAREGHSEHQLGTALDLRSADSDTPAWEYPDWGQTPTGTWLRENSWQYGFVLSYPAEQAAATCYDYEPWHFRYVGREVAEQIHASGLTPREHLWQTSESQP